MRPLLTYDKEEIVELAKRIDTYHISLEAYKDCCSILVSNPRAKSNHELISREERALLPAYEDLMDQTLKDAVCLEYAWGERVG